MATAEGARGFTDDCAVIAVGSETLILTHDMMAEGIHWLSGQSAADVAWKLVAANLSDLAAKGAEPLGVLLGYTLGGDDFAFIEGLREVLTEYRVPLLGGDTVGGAAAQAHGLTAIGRATHRPVPGRSGAVVGDGVWLTGPLGAAMLGFDEVRRGQGGDHREAFARPRPLLREGQALAPRVTAMMDVSDGLLLDASRMARASGTSFALERECIPLSTGVAAAGREDEALRWGEDFQLLFTLPTGVQPPIAAHHIGEVRIAGQFAVLVDNAPPDPSRPLGYLHKSSS